MILFLNDRVRDIGVNITKNNIFKIFMKITKLKLGYKRGKHAES